VLAVRARAVGELLDAGTAEAMAALSQGERRRETEPRRLELWLPSELLGGSRGPAQQVEVSWHDAADFAALLLKGNPSAVEAVRSGEAPLHSSPEWAALLAVLGPGCCESLLAGKDYRMACAGPAMSLLRGSPSVLGPDLLPAVSELCERAATGAGEELRGRVVELVASGEAGREAWQAAVSDLVRAASKAPCAASALPVELVQGWADRIRRSSFLSFAMQITAPSAALLAARQDAPALDPEWLSRMGPAWPAGAGLVFMAQTGSFMYDLHTPSSDSDFSIVYVLPTDQLVAREPPAVEFQHHAEGPFGSDKAGEVEYSGRELGSFLLELAKGNPRNVELLFTEKPHQYGALWGELRAMRQGFLTLRCVKQYLGFVAEKIRKAAAFSEEGAGSAFSAEVGRKVSKSLYQGQHKLYELERVLRGESPVVALVGEEREAVLRLRRQPPSSLGEARALIAEAEAQLRSLSGRAREAEAAAALPAEVDAPALCGWLRGVRERLAQQAAAGAPR